MSKKQRLTQLHKELEKPTPKTSAETGKTIGEPNPERGTRGGFRKVTITISPEMLEELQKIGINRKFDGKKDYDTSSLIREALATFIKAQG